MLATSGRSEGVTEGGPVDAESYARAILNILDDFGNERARLNDMQHAVLNILEDAGAERLKLEAAQRATFNILEDFGNEKSALDDVQRAILNIIEDAGEEKLKLQAAQTATLNILEDFDDEKNKVERINREMAREIAERKRAEEALEVANRELEAFSYSVSHDLRAPLRSIDGFSLALLEDYAGALDDQAKDFLQRVRAATQRMGRLIDDMLALSRVTRFEIRRETVDLSAMAESVVDQLQRAEPERVVEVTIQRDVQAVGDSELLRIVLVNLMSNAWKFTGHRQEPRIEFGATRDAAGAPAYFVRDNGAGFDMAYANKLFGAFQRLHAPSEFPGSGIGLATVQRIVHRHGGQVSGEALPGRGATFSFTLPA